MATVIKAGNVASGAQVTPDATGILQFNTGSGAGTAAMTIDASQNVTFAQAANLPNTFGFKNRIINGACTIDQRNAGAAQNNLAAGWVYTVDRWEVYSQNSSRFSTQQNRGSVTPPSEFKNYLGVVVNTGYTPSASDYNILAQPIEGFNTVDLGFGAAGASSVTLSFWVYSSITGTHSGFLSNNTLVTAYPFTFSIPVANTWTQISVSITGSTSGSWIGATNGIGLYVGFNLGNGSNYQTASPNAWNSSAQIQPSTAVSIVGTTGATFYITGVQLEKGSTATSFDYRPYGTELALCQRYYYKTTNDTGVSTNAPFGSGWVFGTSTLRIAVAFPVKMRTAPTALEQSGTATDYRVVYGSTGVTCNAVPTFGNANSICGDVQFGASTLTVGNGGMAFSNSTNAYLAWSAEL